MEAKTLILMGSQGTYVYSEHTIEYIVTMMRTANNSGSCVLKVYKDEELTKPVFININFILYAEALNGTPEAPLMFE